MRASPPESNVHIIICTGMMQLETKELKHIYIYISTQYQLDIITVTSDVLLKILNLPKTLNLKIIQLQVMN